MEENTRVQLKKMLMEHVQILHERSKDEEAMVDEIVELSNAMAKVAGVIVELSADS